MSRQMSALSKPWLLAMAVLVMLTVACQADPRTTQKIAACPPTWGYTTLQDTVADFFEEQYEGKTNHGSAAAAAAACTADNNCIGFDISGFTIAMGATVRFVDSPGRCTYVRKRCPVRSGYLALANVGWQGQIGSTVTYEYDNADDAMRACDQLPTCTGFNTFGAYIEGEIIGTLAAAVRMCTYIKDSCPAKYGYFNYKDTALAGVTGVDGIATGVLNSQAEAEEFCKLEYRCNGFSSDGSYYIGGIANTVSSPGTCSYIKHSCAPMAGFVVYADSDLRKSSNGRRSDKCFNDVYKACLADPSCKAFNNMRYTWNELPNNVDSGFEAASGICTYVKIAEVLASKGEE
ncbi:hypothetical protein Vretimale_6107 [Volvox reticuliferus]|uniref:Uncharacterized protein n=1 Tax=Volvox reticuliferus TaxID=1737510 RepID=A0A8J4CBM5_9CHLO|nr:hypothetical protein Vretifemale_7978 [Volvox reticuliferus]GIM01344.1 hypothetical protein Vretimale_6107 [Volvox reticuliferus]